MFTSVPLEAGSMCTSPMVTGTRRPLASLHTHIRGMRLAGFDTTRDLITATVFMTLRNPEISKGITDNPNRTISKLTEETLRRDAPRVVPGHHAGGRTGWQPRAEGSAAAPAVRLGKPGRDGVLRP